MSSFFAYLKQIWDSYPIEFVVLIISLIWSTILTVNKYLPVKIQLNKRFSFFKKIKHTICNINVSINCDKHFSSVDIRKKLSSLLRDDFKMISDNEGKFAFKSFKTNNLYMLEVGESEKENKSHIILKNDNAFRTSRTGRIIGLQESLNQMQEIINLFSKEKEETERISSQIKIFPRKEDELVKDKLEIKMEGKDYFIACTSNMIKIITKGISCSKKSTEKAIYKWIEYFI
ncbi:MAG: hypothetical protein ABFQ65_02955 [Nanoarchaeota archaeon]